MQKQEGVVRIRVSIDESGNVLSKELKKSCPYAALNDEALSLFKRASPLPKPPKEMLKMVIKSVLLCLLITILKTI
ncbi:energy transducer TonB [Campylobacter jejuni]|nr:energy transducer TonB [Campylobacter jejuni]ELF7346308.1 energy transducer TonB [Campylobacter jejuni]